MAALTPEETKKIAGKLEDTYQSLRRTAANIRSLLTAGRATCDEIKAYNLWALATYNLQRGMLTTLRAAGESVPELPPYPTLFAWKGVAGVDAWKIDCKKDQQGLTGALRDAMNPGPQTVYLSMKEVDIYSGDQSAIPTTGPSFAMITQAASGGLGFPIVLVIIIAATVIGMTAVGMAALSGYWKEQSIQWETTERANIQAAAFETYTSTRVTCYQDCLARGNDVGTCTDVCNKLVTKPDIKIDSARAQAAPSFITAGAILAIFGVGTIIVLWRRRKRIGRAISQEVAGDEDEDT